VSQEAVVDASRVGNDATHVHRVERRGVEAWRKRWRAYDTGVASKIRVGDEDFSASKFKLRQTRARERLQPIVSKPAALVETLDRYERSAWRNELACDIRDTST
jgi:hypothetical protein